MLSLSVLRDKTIPCRLTGSNCWPSDYKSDVLPTELNRLNVAEKQCAQLLTYLNRQARLNYIIQERGASPQKIALHTKVLERTL